MGIKVNGSDIFVQPVQHNDQCGSIMCLSADDSVLDGFPLCAPLTAPDIKHINQVQQMKSQNKVNFIAVTVLALCVVILLFISAVGWLHKCHKRELQEIRREEIDELRVKVVEMEEIQKKENENEKLV